MTENEPFNLAFKLDNTNSDSKAVYNVDTRAITITGSSGGQSFSFPFDVVDQTQTANGKTVRLQLVAVKPSSDPRVVFLVKAPTKWETSAVGDRRQDRRSGLGDDAMPRASPATRRSSSASSWSSSTSAFWLQIWSQRTRRRPLPRL